jgi:hypothetical protein
MGTAQSWKLIDSTWSIKSILKAVSSVSDVNMKVQESCSTLRCTNNTNNPNNSAPQP